MIERVAVIVPAADEQDRIADCLAAIERARRRLLTARAGVERVDVIVVLDGCRDGTAEVVAELARTQPLTVLTSSARCVGAARRLGTATAIDLAGAATSQLWLANTDADSQVPADWLRVMITAANAGAEVVLGTVLPGAELPRALRPAWLAAHSQRSGHPHVHGANFGIRADAYVELGGWQALPADEDVELATRAADAGLDIVRTGAIAVTTSARLVGRTPRGFSSYLRQLRDRPHAADCAPSEID